MTASRRILFEGSLLASLDLAFLRTGDRLVGRLFGDRARRLSDVYVSETYALADDSGDNLRSSHWIPIESELRGIKYLLSYGWLAAAFVFIVIGIVPVALNLPAVIRLAIAVPLAAMTATGFAAGSIHGPIDGLRRRAVGSELFIRHSKGNSLFVGLWLAYFGLWLYLFVGPASR